MLFSAASSCKGEAEATIKSSKVQTQTNMVIVIIFGRFCVNTEKPWGRHRLIVDTYVITGRWTRVSILKCRHLWGSHSQHMQGIGQAF